MSNKIVVAVMENKLATLVVVSVSIMVLLVVVIVTIGPDSRGSTRSSAPQRVAQDEWAVSFDCRTGYFSIGDKPTALYASPTEYDDRVYHTIPAGDPISATGQCSYYLVEVVHRGDRGWVFKHDIN